MGKRALKLRSQWSEGDMHAAVSAVKDKRMTYQQAATAYSIPISTIESRLKNRYGSTGPNTVLSSDEELTLVDWIIHTAKRGFPITKNQLVDSVQKKVARKASILAKRQCADAAKTALLIKKEDAREKKERKQKLLAKKAKYVPWVNDDSD